MFKRIAHNCIIALLAVSFIFPAGIAYAGDTTPPPTPTSSQERPDPISSGLWAGVNLDFSSRNYTTSSSTTSTRSSATKPTTTVPAEPTAGAYVALGDSVAAGVGLPSLVETSRRDARCGRTTEAYPYMVAEATNLPLVHVACSAATARDLFTKQYLGGPDIPAQIDRAFSGGTPDLISITAGANDIRWTWFLGRCYDSNCARDRYTLLAEAAISRMGERLDDAFEEISNKSAGNPPTVVITGYYDPVSPDCSNVTPRVTAAEVAWISERVTSINATIQNTAAQYNFVRYAPVSFIGHDLCSDDSWIQGRGDSRPFHPTAAGQTAMAQAVVSAISR